MSRIGFELEFGDDAGWEVSCGKVMLGMKLIDLRDVEIKY